MNGYHNHNRLALSSSTHKGSASKVIKNKSRLKHSFKKTVKVNITNERQMYLQKFLEPSFSNHNQQSNPNTLPSIAMTSFQHKSSLFSKANLYPHYESTPRFSRQQQHDAPPPPSNREGISYNLVNLIKRNGLTAISPINFDGKSKKPMINGFTSSKEYKWHDNNDFQKKQFEPMETDSSKLTKVEQWKMPEKSNLFKSTMESKLDMVFTSKDEHVVQRNVANLQETLLVEKLNSINVIQSDRKSVCSTIKSFLTNSFNTFNIKQKLRQFIPFKHDDYEISDRAHVERREDVLVPWTDEMEAEIGGILSRRSVHLVTAFSINIHTNDLLTLKGTTWLNDSVCILYLYLFKLISYLLFR